MNVSTYLDQGEVWIPKEGEPVEVESMSIEWRRNAAKWLVRRSDILRVECRIAAFRDELHDADFSDAEFRREETDDLVNLLRGISKPDEWIKGTELYRSLVAGLPVVSMHIEPPPAFLDAMSIGFGAPGIRHPFGR